jgi:esterase/lipase superfamily enzyme
MRTNPVVCAAFLLWAMITSGASVAQSSATLDQLVKQSLSSLIAELRIKIEHRLPADQNAGGPRGPIDPALIKLGKPMEITLSAPIPGQGLLNFSARVRHESGTSEWTLGTLYNGEIVTYALLKVDTASDLLTSRDPTPIGETAAKVPTVDPRVVEFLFATTRREAADAQPTGVSYGGERAPLSFGAASVRIPEDHKIGHIELPSSWSLFGISLSSSAPDEREHFIVKRVVSLSEDAFDRVIKAKNAKTALVFVHGFNTTFQDALYRNAQIVWDLQYNGLSVLFTWASRGDIINYVYDKESAYLARTAFIALLEKLKRDFGIEQVNVLAHSMGNLIVVDALASNAQTSNPVQIARLMMAAPDVDRDQFEALIPKSKAIVGSMTLYASSADRALLASRKLAGDVPRAGDVPTGGPVTLPNLETIDVTAMGEDIFGLNHGAFAASRDVMEDISLALRLSLPSPRLTQIRAAPEPPAVAKYWKYVR